MENYVILITTSNEQEAANIAKSLVENNIARCVNIVSSIRSIYMWKGRLEDERETLLIVKARKEDYAQLEKKVKELHSYEVPEIIAFPIVEGSKDYLDWLGGKN
ncbi:Divalent ion tolerance protein, CutA1 [Candidatus Magnetoovum chiemensis]|nr:Divalent ion tolerance protein, CutA1 [Candidatus Magnetoovum chiemensis]